MTKVSTIGLDLAKTVFQLHGLDAHGNVVLRRPLRRAEVLPFFATPRSYRYAALSTWTRLSG